MLELIVSKQKDVEDIVLVENGKILEHYTSCEQDNRKRLEGNIYISEVRDIISGMQAAFVDFGEGKNGFLHLKDALPQIDEKTEKIDLNIDIKKILKRNQKLLVQVKKDSDNKKGARVSTHISLPGKYVVLMPNTNFITISQKIENIAIKNEMIDIVKNILPEGCGAIIRTSAIKVSNEKICNDIKELIDKWKKIQDKFISSSKIGLICRGENIVEKIIKDLTNKNLDKIITNSKNEYDFLKKYQNHIQVTYENQDSLLSIYNLQKQIEKKEKRKIWLNCGGFITIDKTEALTAIDVNTGKYTGNKDLENTIFKVNKEATIEIVKQLRLRDIGGIIIIDYIDMHNKDNKNKIEELLKSELKDDRAKTQVEGFTRLNLMELTRKHLCSYST